MGAAIGVLFFCSGILALNFVCERSKTCQKVLVWVSKNIMGVDPADFEEA